MYQASFQLNKVRRLIKARGQVFIFKRPGRNEFKEPNGETESQEIRGVFHELVEYQPKTASEASTTIQKSLPMLLTLWEDVGGLHHQDILSFNEKTYKINGIKNLLEANLVADISLEEVQVQ